MQFTDSQAVAISHQGNNILVSASAGSGKTRVLVERVLQRLLAGENINEFLIVTFTNAAAAEMKERLEKAIRQALPDANPDQKQHLIKQLRLINVANISTLHAFAMRLIEQYHYTIDLDPQFRLVDDAENTLIKQEVYQDLLDQAYVEDEATEEHPFAHFVQQFKNNSQDDGDLQKAVFTLFNFAMARPDTTDWLNHLTDAYESADDYAQTPFYQDNVRPKMLQDLEGLVNLAQRAIDEAPDTNDELPAENRLNNLMDDYAQLNDLWQLAQQPDLPFDTLRKQVLDTSFVTFGKNPNGKSPRFEKDSLAKPAWEAVNQNRKNLSERLKDWKKRYFILDSKGQQRAMDGAKATLRQLVSFTQKFQDQFLTEKLRRKVLDFNDLEHFALQIVQQDRVADELRQQYREIMVDEYQDTNQLQEAILSRIAGPSNTFQVGDIKQSIYKFRQADPTLFGSKLTHYPQDADSEVITLQENFRSQPNVTNFINYIFEQVMDHELGDVDYTGSAKLVAGADYYPDDIAKKAELLVYLQDNGDAATDNDAVMPNVDDDQYNGTIGQIRLMALKIKQIMQDPDYLIYDRSAQEKRHPRFSDITILVPTKNQNLDVLDVFGALDLPVTIEGTENFFQTTEISVMLSLLRVIDNPHQDIPLAAVLRSPLYGLDDNDLALIRLQNQQDDFYQAVRTLGKTPLEELPYVGDDAEKTQHVQQVLQRFLHDLDDFKALATQNQIVDLIWQIYNRTGWLDYVGGLPSGAQRQANLHALYERAASYQRSSFVGLYQFIQYVMELQAQDRDLSAADANTSDDTIHLMTIHHSKGLEFPIVFVLNSTHQMVSQNETTGPILVDAKGGAGLDYVDAKHHMLLPTAQREYVKQVKRQGAFSEQLRVLYVALTRAEQELYLVGTYKTLDDLDKTWKLSLMADGVLPVWIRENGKSFMDLIGMALLRHPEADTKMTEAYQSVGAEFVMPDHKNWQPEIDFSFDITLMNQQTLQAAQAQTGSMQQAVAAEPVVQASEASKQDWTQVLNFNYPYESATRATAYQSVSELKRLFEDPDLQAGRAVADLRLTPNADAGLRFVDDELPEPAFMQTQTQEVSAAAVGTATHLVMQRVNLQNGAPSQDDLAELVKHLVATQAFDATVAKKIRLDKITHFFSANPLGQAMVAHADTLQREVPFSLLLDANTLYKDYNGDEKVLVHGIMDGFFYVGDEVWLFDYKTDYIGPGQSAKELLTERYSGQLNIYAQALVAQGYPYPRRFIYAFGPEETVQLD
ncbi:ATP-dependent helicase/nuclease subunit A [Weissella uvarum]|uniref:helicase-exonuclease AddAB subunit AddA n=1 Tax=Weissella uvarum TaxID=1479233 RepID=UPI00195F7F01|nr:helicase-exonuclease AddAB subunit AddA [Weissella uvarum]MBM7617634.1 ATP-dependent helicase/nuclease subunit A [Weissella uvarum]MCM0595983.1 helicase-exonuclease AddAB subunit AddA [Weissella uvarum]